MKIALVGYGKMGKEIEQILSTRNHQTIVKFCSDNPLNREQLSNVDAAIDFSTPDVVVSNISTLLENNIPTVVGTTGWNDSYNKVKKWVDKTNGSLVHSSNFSIGVNLFFKLNEYLANLMSNYTEYQPNITEIHHTQKLDAPSGTAITLAEGIIAASEGINDWYCPQNDKKNTSSPFALPIEAERKEDVKGVHKINYNSTIDTISIQHAAKNRKGFALGAVVAAEWITTKKGMFTMKDVLHLA